MPLTLEDLPIGTKHRKGRAESKINLNHTYKLNTDVSVCSGKEKNHHDYVRVITSGNHYVALQIVVSF